MAKLINAYSIIHLVKQFGVETAWLSPVMPKDLAIGNKRLELYTVQNPQSQSVTVKLWQNLPYEIFNIS